MKNMFFLGLMIFALKALAYIPEYETLMVRVAANHGNGTYQIQRTVKWNEAGSPMEIFETWVVGENGQMKLSFTGAGSLQGVIQGEALLAPERKVIPDHLLHIRSSKTLRNLLVRLGLAPKESLENRPSLGTGPTVRYKPQEFMSLSRVDGVIAYAVGNPQKPTFFIEQDQFVVSKMVFPSGATVVAKGYQSYPESFYFPKTVTYTWGDKTVEVITQKVSYLGKKSSESFALKNIPTKLPASPTISEFYSRFR